MPVDKQTNGSTAKPFTPSLSSHFRSTKSPLTPKVIGSAQSSPVLSPRREIHNRTGPLGRDEALASPLNGNVTPRSGTRNSRIGTESPATPGGGKGGVGPRTRAVSINDTIKRGQANEAQSVGLGISSPGARSTAATRPENVTSTVPSPPYTVARQVVPVTGPFPEREDSPQFFRADQANPILDSGEPRQRPKLGPKAATFFYATENPSNISVKTEPARANSLGTTKNDDAKFFHANDAPPATSRTVVSRPVLMKKKSSASIVGNRGQSPDAQQRSRSKSRAPSPLKDTQPKSGPAQPLSPKRQLYKAQAPSNDVRQNLDRRKSVSSNVSTRFQPGHKKSASTTSSNIHMTPTKKTTSPQPMTRIRADSQLSSRPAVPSEVPSSAHFPELPVSPSSLSPRSTSLTSSNTLATSDTERSDSLRLQSPVEGQRSPTTSVHLPHPPNSAPLPLPQPPPQSLQQQKQAELAASARRERKVLDLEISNSSLLAINKTLEREMRKQSAELRRFRRLSRSGRLSIATAGSLRAASGASGLSTLSEDAEDMANLDAEDLLDGLNDMDISSSDEDDDLESTLSTSSSVNPSSASTSLSPTSRKMRRRRRDEKRLLLDLSKHQQLLVDSQKLNQSIRRCLGWTEDMIREGGRALEYKVGIGDVKLGGRVLRAEEEEDEHTEHSEAERWSAKEDDVLDLSSCALDMKTQMEKAVLWAGPGGMQGLDGTVVRDLSPNR